jgi:hypothetical protein
MRVLMAVVPSLPHTWRGRASYQGYGFRNDVNVSRIPACDANFRFEPELDLHGQIAAPLGRPSFGELL